MVTSVAVMSVVVVIGAAMNGVMVEIAERSQSDAVATGAETTDATMVGLLSPAGVGMTVETTGAGRTIVFVDTTQELVIRVAEDGDEWLFWQWRHCRLSHPAALECVRSYVDIPGYHAEDTSGIYIKVG